jgi:hypothetical protein
MYLFALFLACAIIAPSGTAPSWSKVQAVGAMAGGRMIAATVASVIGWTLALLVMGILLCLLGVYGLAALRIWWARQTGRGSCQSAAGT